MFYENEIYKGTKDPIGKFIQTGGEEGDIRSVIQKNLQGIPFDYGNINNVPSFLNNFILNNNSQEQLANLKKGVRLIRAMSDIPMDDIKGKEIKMLDEKQIEKIKSIDTENYNSAWEKYKTQANAKIEEVSKNAELIKKNTIEFNAKQELKSLFTGEKWGPDPNEPNGRFKKQDGKSIYDSFLKNKGYLEKPNFIAIQQKETPSTQDSEIISLLGNKFEDLEGNTLYLSSINNPSNGFTVLEECFVKEISLETKEYLKTKIANFICLNKEELYFTSEKEKKKYELTTRYEFSKINDYYYGKAQTREKSDFYFTFYTGRFIYR